MRGISHAARVAASRAGGPGDHPSILRRVTACPWRARMAPATGPGPSWRSGD